MIFNSKLPILAFCVLGLSLLEQTHAESPRFIPITPENTRMSDGTELPSDLASVGWKWKPDIGNSGVFESNPDILSKTLMTVVDGLTPNKPYEVFGYFWADGYGLDHPKTRSQRPAQFGTSLATLHTFDGPDQPVRGHVCAWEVTPGGTAGASYGLKATIEEESPLEGINKLKLRHGDAKLIRARLGLLRADASGKLPVFFADYPYNLPGGPAWIDGVAVRAVDTEGLLEEGWKKGTWLHLALRAGDSVTIEREIQRGADVNILDEERLSPLFYAVVATDQGMVKRLLDMGADPNIANQSISPLCAAAVMSSEAIAKQLLDAGAEVPLEISKDHGTLCTEQTHPALLHPVICAIQSGSVPVLKMLLEKQPSLDIVKLTDLKPIQLEGNKTITSPITVSIWSAITGENWNMAMWLIEAGLFERERDRLENGNLITLCISAGEPGLEVLEALIKAGINPVDFSSGPRPRAEPNGDGREHDAFGGWMLPQDILSAAVWAGDMPLVRRFLPKATYAPLAYIERLYMTAVYRRDSEMAELLTNHFKRIRPQRWKPTEATNEKATMRDDDLRVLLPRTTTPPARPNRVMGQYTLGVIASPDAMDPASLLSTTASNKDGWKVVDRDLLETTMLETRIAKPWLDGKHNLAPFGDKLNADVLAIIDVTKGENERIYSIEMVEVATGLVIHREHLSDKVFKPDKDLPALLDRTVLALDAASRRERRRAITLLSFTARGGLPNELALASLLHATVQHKVDSTSGFISLTRSQSARLVEEQALQGKDSLWGAAHLVEGSVSPAEQAGTIRVSLRLETLDKNKTSNSVDAEAVGSIEDAASVMDSAWKNLLTSAQDTLKDSELTSAESPTPAIASEEAKRLLREADWLMSAKMDPKRVLTLIESASALGAPHGDLIRVHLDHLFRDIHSLSLRIVGKPESVKPIHTAFGHLRELPVPFDLADRMAHDLPKARELLHQASFYFTKHRNNLPHARSRQNQHGNEFWLTINALSFMRAAIYEDLLTPEQREDYEMLGRELDAFTKEYYVMLAEAPGHDNGRSALLSNGHRWILKRNPELVPGMLRSIHQVNNIKRFFPHNSIDKNHGLTQLAKEMIRALEDNHTPKAELFKADLRCYSAKDGEFPALTRDFIAAAMNANRAEWYEIGFSTQHTYGMVNRHTPTIGFCECVNGGAMLPTLVHAPRPAPEAIRKAGTYLQMQYFRDAIPNPMETRWYRLGSSEKWYDQALQAASLRKDAKQLSELLDALPLHHMYSGHNHQLVLEKRYRNTLQQLSNPEVAQKSVTATLMADLRTFTSPKAGAARWFIRDQENPELLWIFYFESQGNGLGLDFSHDIGSYQEEPSTLLRRTWLLGIDCRTGSIKTKVDLEKAALKAVGCNDPVSDCGMSEMIFDQNKSAIMVSICPRHDRHSSSHSHSPMIMVIDKKSGEARSLPEGHDIARFTQRKTHACWVNVAGVGDDFYFIDDTGYNTATNPNRKSNDTKTATVYRLDAEMKLTPLVEHGRRPSLSPFDGIETIPTEIAPDGDRVLVYNDMLHAHFNTADSSWDVVNDHHTKFGFKMYHFAQREIQRSIGAIHKIQIQGQDTGWNIDFEKLMPGRLWYFNDKLGAGELAVKLEIPRDYLENYTIVTPSMEPAGNGSNSTRTVYKKMSLSDYLASQPFHLVVLNQTADNMIVGLQAGSRLKWKRPSREGAHLPFLWKISKDELLGNLIK